MTDTQTSPPAPTPAAPAAAPEPNGPKAPYHHFRADPNSQLNQVIGVVRNTEGRAIEIMKVSALLLPAIGAFLLFFEDQTFNLFNWAFLFGALAAISFSIWSALHCMKHFSVSKFIAPEEGSPEARTDHDWAMAFRHTLMRSERNVENCRKGQMAGIVCLLAFVLSMGLTPVLPQIGDLFAK